jgi:Putative MetA-pathway of phenol degradation
MTFPNHLTAVFAAGLGLSAATPSAVAHGDSGGGGGVILPAGVTLVSTDYDVIKFNEISDARLRALALRGIAEVHSLKTISVPSLTIGYGLTNDLTFAVRLPYLHNQEIRETDPASGGVNARGGVSGFGDASFTGTYRFYNDHNSGVEAALIFGIKAPTGPAGRHDLSGERFETEHQPGSGSWDGIIGGTVSRELDRLTLSANVLYQFSGNGTADTKLGDRLSYGVTASYRVWSSGVNTEHYGASYPGRRFDGPPSGMMHHGGPHEEDDGAHTHHTQRANHDVSHEHSQNQSGTAIDLSLGLNGEWAGKVDTAGDINQNTGGNILFLTPGVKITVDRWSAYINAGIPVVRELNGIQSDPDWRLMTGASVRF